jgi:hypothetical protein
MQTYTVDHVVAALRWLDDWPVGLKLNTPLSHFFRTTFAAGVVQWGCEWPPLSKLTRISGRGTPIVEPPNVTTTAVQLKWIGRLYPSARHFQGHDRPPHGSPPNLSRDHLPPGAMAAE